MTRKELRKYYDDRETLCETKEMISNLKAYVKNTGIDLEREIVFLEESIPKQAASLSAREADVIATLDAVDDLCCRDELKKHFCQGIPWKEIAFPLKETAPVIRARCQRALNNARIW